MTRSGIFSGAAIALVMTSVMHPALGANDLQYDVQDQRNAATFKQLIWQTRSCMNEGAHAMLIQGARDSSTIARFVQNTCGGPLASFMTQTLQRPNAEVVAFIQAMAYDELNRIPGLSRSNSSPPLKNGREIAVEEASRRGFEANERKDYAEAKRWWQQAADRGFAKAQYNLAVLYTDGRGVPKNYVEAARLYRLAANQGLAVAQYNLGVLYESGAGVEKNETLARSWYMKAAEQGDQDARNALADLDAKIRQRHGAPTSQGEGQSVPLSRQGAQPINPPDAAR